MDSENNYCRNPDSGDWGVVIRFRDPDGGLHTCHVSDKLIHGDPSKLADKLTSRGLFINREHDEDFAEYFRAVTDKWRGITGRESKCRWRHEPKRNIQAVPAGDHRAVAAARRGIDGSFD